MGDNVIMESSKEITNGADVQNPYYEIENEADADSVNNPTNCRLNMDLEFNRKII